MVFEYFQGLKFFYQQALKQAWPPSGVCDTGMRVAYEYHRYEFVRSRSLILESSSDTLTVSVTRIKSFLNLYNTQK